MFGMFVKVRLGAIGLTTMIAGEAFGRTTAVDPIVVEIKVLGLFESHVIMKALIPRGEMTPEVGEEAAPPIEDLPTLHAAEVHPLVNSRYVGGKSRLAQKFATTVDAREWI